MTTARSHKRFTNQQRQKIRDEVNATLERLRDFQPRKASPPCDYFTMEWGEDPKTRQTIKCIRTRPFTPAEFWQACQIWFPPEFLPLAAGCMLELTRNPPQAQPPKRKRGGQEGGVATKVEALMGPPLYLDQHTARSVIAGQLWGMERESNKIPKPVLSGDRLDCRDYDDAADEASKRIREEVAALHRDWKHRQKKRRAP
jgi:hypothetical protein